MTITARRRAVLFLLIILCVAAPLGAATRTWAGGTGTWSNGANWVGGIAPAPGDDLVFSAGATVLNSSHAEDIPTLSTWMLLALVAVLAALGAAGRL